VKSPTIPNKKEVEIMKRLAQWRWSLPLLFALPIPALAADDQKQDPSASPAIPHHRLLEDTFRVRLGMFYAQTTTEARFGTQTGGAAVDVNFEDALGLDSRRWVGEAGAYWRITDHWRLDVDYFSIKRSGTRQLGQSVTWGDFTYAAGTNVDASTKVSDLRAVVGYSFFKRPDKELGLGFGLHATGFDASINASGSAGGGGVTSSGGGATSNNITAPLPVFTLYGSFALTDTWALSLRSDWLSLSYDKYSGAIRSTAVDFVYQPFTHLAFGFGMHSLLIKLDVHNPNSSAEGRFTAYGPAAYAAYSF
jgi:hypothetical protein